MKGLRKYLPEFGTRLGILALLGTSAIVPALAQQAGGQNQQAPHLVVARIADRQSSRQNHRQPEALMNRCPKARRVCH